jgi:hypothetical protein
MMHHLKKEREINGLFEKHKICIQAMDELQLILTHRKDHPIVEVPVSLTLSTRKSSGRMSSMQL